jgi:hypothetical protein
MGLFRKKSEEISQKPQVSGVSMASVPRRVPVIVCGKVTRLRTRPAHGIPTCVITLRDDTGFVTALWTGRREIGGITLGRSMCLEGVCTDGPDGATFMNPSYTLQ